MSRLSSAVAALCALGTAAHAAPRGVVVAPFGALGISPKEAQRVQRWVISAGTAIPELRIHRARRFERRLAQRPGCATDVRCVARVAERLRVGPVLVGDVGSIGGANVVYLQLLVGAEVRARESAILDPRVGLRAAVRAVLYKLLLPERYVGAMRIRSNVDGSWTYLDGRRVGRGKEIELSSVPVGRHAVRVTHPAHRDFVRFVQVRFRAATSVEAQLEPIAVQAQSMSYLAGKPLTSSELPWYRRWWAVAIFGAAVFASATVVAAILPQDVDRDRAVRVEPGR